MSAWLRTGFIMINFQDKLLTRDWGAQVFLNLLPEAEQKKFYEQLVYDSGRATSEVGFWYFDHQKASIVDENKVTGPMLIIGAGKDRITPVSISRKIAKKYENADYKEYSNHAHWILHEPGWETVAEDIFKWLQAKI